MQRFNIFNMVEAKISNMLLSKVPLNSVNGYGIKCVLKLKAQVQQL